MISRLLIVTVVIVVIVVIVILHTAAAVIAQHHAIAKAKVDGNRFDDAAVRHGESHHHVDERPWHKRTKDQADQAVDAEREHKPAHGRIDAWLVAARDGRHDELDAAGGQGERKADPDDAVQTQIDLWQALDGQEQVAFGGIARCGHCSGDDAAPSREQVCVRRKAH